MYYVFKFLGKYTIAIPVDTEGIKPYKYFKAVSVKQYIYRLALSFLIKVRLHKLLVNTNTTPVPMFSDFPFNEWLATVEIRLGKGKLIPVVTFPSQLARKRFYVNLIGSNGNCVGFSKISLSDENDLYLSNEADNIRRIQTMTTGFKIPEVLINDTFDSHKYLIFEPIPESAKHKHFKWDSYPLMCSNEIAENTKAAKELESLSWWPSFERIMGREASDDFIANLGIDKNHKAAVALVHGDLHSGNMIMADGDIWLFDWESSTNDAPVMTDELVFFLASNQRKLVSDPDHVAEKLRNEFLHQESRVERTKVGLALAFLSTTDRKDARDMIEKLDFEEGTA